MGSGKGDSNQLKCSMNFLPLIASHCILCCCIRVVVVVVFWHSRCCGALCNRQSHAHVHAHAQWDTHHMQAALTAAEPWQRPQQRRRVYLYCVCVCVSSARVCVFVCLYVCLHFNFTLVCYFYTHCTLQCFYFHFLHFTLSLFHSLSLSRSVALALLGLHSLSLPFCSLRL